MKRAAGVRMAGFGYAVPERRVPNAELELRFGLAAGWIERRTGIRERRWAGDGDTLSGLAAAAAARALESSGVGREAIGLTLLATSTPDHLLPPSAPLVAHRLGLTGCGAVDMAGACAGFLYALTLGEAHVRAHGTCVLVIAANILSRRINPFERSGAILFADAAGAVALVPSDDAAQGIAGLSLASEGGGYGLVGIAAGGSARPFAEDTALADTHMTIADGRGLFADAVRLMTACSGAALADGGLEAAEVDRFVPHQANARIFAAVGGRIGMRDEAVVSTIGLYGNSSAATIPLSLAIAHADRPIVSGETLLLAAAGAGLTGGALVWRA